MCVCFPFWKKTSICIYKVLDHPTEEIQHHAPKIYINDTIMKVIIVSNSDTV